MLSSTSHTILKDVIRNVVNDEKIKDDEILNTPWIDELQIFREVL